MSFEYFAVGNAGPAVAEPLRAALAGRYASVDGGDQRHLNLRRLEDPPREKWPRDLEISLEPNRILVVFHSGSRRERDEILRLLETTLGGLGIFVSFDEA